MVNEVRYEKSCQQGCAYRVLGGTEGGGDGYITEELAVCLVYAVCHNLCRIDGRPTPDGNEDVRSCVVEGLDAIDDTLNGRVLTDS